jgi:integrase
VPLYRLASSPVATLTSADGRRAFASDPLRLPRLNPSRRVLYTNPCTKLVTERLGHLIEQLAATAGLPEIDLHDVRHSYATAGRNAKIDWKALSMRIGHADVAFTMKQYVQTDLEADREVANTLADLIIGGLLATEVDDQADEPDKADEA